MSLVAAALPAFTPVPVKSRKGGWSPERQRAFIAALADTLCVERAAAKVGLTRESAYRLRKRPAADSFAAAWDSVMARRRRGMTDPDLIYHRAFYGTLKPIVRGGQLVAWLHRADNRALMSTLHRLDQADRSRERLKARLRERSR